VDALTTLNRNHATVFPWKAAALNKAFERLCWRAGIEDLRFHDLRHTATTRLAEKLPNVIELAAVTGHLSLQVLKRYYHPTAESLALKLG
jgi:integrase